MPLVFYVDCCRNLPTNIKLHAPSSHIWNGTFVKETKTIENLKSMMSFYGIKAYFALLLQYDGSCNFKFQIYNPYGMEICYPIHMASSSYEVVCSDLDLDHSASVYNSNVISNFTCVHKLVIQRKHLDLEDLTKVNIWSCNFCKDYCSILIFYSF